MCLLSPTPTADDVLAPSVVGQLDGSSPADGRRRDNIRRRPVEATRPIGPPGFLFPLIPPGPHPYLRNG